MNRSIKRTHLFERLFFYNNVKVFAVPFDQFNASLLNKSIHF